MKFRRGKARARDDRLEIAGQQTFGLAQAPDAPAENFARRRRARPRYSADAPARLAADVRQRAGDLSALVDAAQFEERLAAGLISCKSGEMVVSRPAREVGPFDRFKLAACKLRRPFGQCGGGRKPYHRPDEAYDRAPQKLRTRSVSFFANKCWRISIPFRSLARGRSRARPMKCQTHLNCPTNKVANLAADTIRLNLQATSSAWPFEKCRRLCRPFFGTDFCFTFAPCEGY